MGENQLLHAKAEARKAGLALITELQYLALAHNIAGVAINWTGGAVGEGHLYQGLHKNTAKEAQAGQEISVDDSERRWFELSNGERIWDASGNAYSWVFDNIHCDESGIIRFPFRKEYWPSYALIRGCYGNSYEHAGIFHLLVTFPNEVDGEVGFRCTLP